MQLFALILSELSELENVLSGFLNTRFFIRKIFVQYRSFIVAVILINLKSDTSRLWITWIYCVETRRFHHAMCTELLYVYVNCNVMDGLLNIYLLHQSLRERECLCEFQFLLRDKYKHFLLSLMLFTHRLTLYRYHIFDIEQNYFDCEH